jgi:hypothetical protein
MNAIVREPVSDENTLVIFAGSAQFHIPVFGPLPQEFIGLRLAAIASLPGEWIPAMCAHLACASGTVRMLRAAQRYAVRITASWQARHTQSGSRSPE